MIPAQIYYIGGCISNFLSVLVFISISVKILTHTLIFLNMRKIRVTARVRIIARFRVTAGVRVTVRVTARVRKP